MIKKAIWGRFQNFFRVFLTKLVDPHPTHTHTNLCLYLPLVHKFKKLKTSLFSSLSRVKEENSSFQNHVSLDDQTIAEQKGADGRYHCKICSKTLTQKIKLKEHIAGESVSQAVQ